MGFTTLLFYVLTRGRRVGVWDYLDRTTYNRFRGDLGMLEIREIPDDCFIDFAKGLRYGTAEYLFMNHIWYYGSIPTLRRYFGYDTKGTDIDVILRYQSLLERVRQGYYGFTDYDEELCRQAKERVFKRG